MAGYVYLGSRYVGYCGGGSDGTFAGGLMLAPGNLYHMSGSGTGPTSYAIDDTWNSHNTYGSSLFTAVSHNTGISTSYASSYFTASDLSSVQIPTGSISYGGYSDWRIPSLEEMSIIIFGSTADWVSPKTRTKAMVNGSEIYKANVRVTNNAFAGSYSPTYGILVFPDNGVFTGASVNDYSPGECARLTKADVDNYVAQGAVFIEMVGSYTYYHSDANYLWIPPNTQTYWCSNGNLGTIFGAAYPYDTPSTVSNIGIADGAIWSSAQGGNVADFNSYREGWGSSYGSDSNYVVGAPITLVRGQMDL